jgi:hypothetical protein
MKWNFTLLFLVTFALVSYGLYQLSYEVQELERDLHTLKADIAGNRESIQVLKAEWAYENRPEVLQALAAKYLPLLLVAPYQVATLAEVPQRNTDPNSVAVFAVPLPRKRPSRPEFYETPPPTGNVHMATFSASGKAGGLVR